jgi:hypothetical protein
MQELGLFLRDVVKTFLLLMGVALCSIPSTFIYFLLRGEPVFHSAGPTTYPYERSARIVSLVIGGVLALFIWHFGSKRLWNVSGLSSAMGMLGGDPFRSRVGQRTIEVPESRR